MVKTIDWVDGKVFIIDQTKLPLSEEVLWLKNYIEVADSISSMKIRGAPAIGVAAAFGVALGARNSKVESTEQLVEELEKVCEVLSQTRPTAVNLSWALDRMKKVFSEKDLSPEELKNALEKEALKIFKEDIEANKKMGEYGASLIEDGDNILTHCNAGALATAGYGTALGVIRAAVAQGKKVHVYVDETRPLLQGARLTAWELKTDKIPFTLITDNMAGYFMSLGKIDKVMVGADRIAANGDVANKIGTYSLAVLADKHKIPFYIAAPLSTIDLNISSGKEIPIEERSPKEVTVIQGKQIASDDMNVANPAFDVTPSEYISAIITEQGVVRAPFGRSLTQLKKGT